MDYSLTTLVAINLILFFGCLLQGLIGYGMGMFCAPLLFLISPDLVPAPLILLSTAVTIIMLLRDKADLQFTQVSWAMVGGLFGVTLAGSVLTLASKQQFELAFGILILLAVVISVWGYKPVVNKTTNCIAGFISAFMGTITAVGGPPMALLYQHGNLKNIKANLTAFFVFLNIIAMFTLAIIGEVSAFTLNIFLLALPGSLLGLYVSGKIGNIINPARIRNSILLISALTALIAILRSLL